MHRSWKQRKAAQKKYRGIAQARRAGVRKAKAQLEINRERDSKSMKKSFYNYITSKIKLRTV